MARERLTRQEIKHDEFVSFVVRMANWLEDNRRIVIPAVVGLVLVMVLGAGGRAWWQAREQKALSALGEVEGRYNATVEGEQQQVFQDTSAGLSYPTREEKYQAVLESVDELTEKYRTGAAVTQAIYYRGLALRQMDRHEEAVTAFEEVLSRRPSPLARALSRVALAETHEASGLWSEAESVYRMLFDEAPAIFPREMALLGRARCLEQVNELAEAKALYNQLIDSYPNSPYEREARQRLEELG
ncbi:MAG: tetratricopeptide repeat protein [Acidobacteria bacterium]|nr:tetratricopeptide repeat protein [Acidobacteriota bacterium]